MRPRERRSDHLAGSARRGVEPLAAVLLIAFCGALATTGPGIAWNADGHRTVSRYAAQAAATGATDLPDFFVRGAEQIADASVVPDARRNRRLPQLRSTEAPDHYLDWELLEGATLPETRYDFLSLLADKRLSPHAVGLVPYAIIEATQELTLAFAEHRARPRDDFIRMRVLRTAGLLSHYAADLSQPLHTTIHHNGRARPDYSSPRTGIHHQVDSLIGRTEASLLADANEPSPGPYPETWAGVLEQLGKSHALVDRVYELKPHLSWDGNTAPEAAGDETPAARGATPPEEKPARPAINPEVLDFASERLTASVVFTSRLFVTAWRDSAELELEQWRFEPDQPSLE